MNTGIRSTDNIRLWCLGNEMDALWQIGANTAQAVRKRFAREFAKLMRWLDPNIELDCMRFLQPQHVNIRRMGKSSFGRDI